MTGARQARRGHRPEMPQAENRNFMLWSRALPDSAEVVDCAHDSLADRQLRRPAERPDPGRVEKDEWIVADPAAIAAGILELRRDSAGGR